tara:strand:- start:554 stop:1006 length:453 start_codon:yes stop_codon:yes gene_type:complete
MKLDIVVIYLLFWWTIQPFIIKSLNNNYFESDKENFLVINLLFRNLLVLIFALLTNNFYENTFNFSKMYEMIKENYKILILFNIFSALSLFSYYYLIKNYDSSIFSLIISPLIVITTALFDYYYNETEYNNIKILGILTISIGVFITLNC